MTCVCGALSEPRCICEVRGWTVALYPRKHPHDCEHATWNGWTADIGCHQERIRSFHRPVGMTKKGYSLTFREWADRQGVLWTHRQGL